MNRADEPPRFNDAPPATFNDGWWELYRGGELIATWNDFDYVLDLLNRAGPARPHVIVIRDRRGMARGRCVVYWEDGEPQLIPIERPNARKGDRS